MQQHASFPMPLGKERVKIEEFADLPQYSDDYSPSAIASGPKHSLWVTDVIDQDYGENLVARIDTSGTRRKTFYYQGLSTEGSSFEDIAAGPDGALWITDYYNWQIVRMTTGGTISTFKLNAAPIGITVGPDKALWFTEYGAIGRITTKGSVTIYPAGGFDDDITAGPDGALWFTELTGNAIGRITTHGKIRTYTKGISGAAGPYWIAPGPDGALWFTEATGGRIGRITTSGKVTEYSRGITPTEEPVGIAAGPDGAMWFTEYETYGSYVVRESKVGRITMTGRVSEYSQGLSGSSGPGDIVAGPDGNMWFVETDADRTGRASVK
jgi:virginiamycin B lyase